ncbi:MAG TPA: c-type cytochrome domain-containing protein [Cyclobacteriaceae bacterium]|nr:c-type cytochrome domain-containing protein [Cyclobacteriaceae bacterium]
MPSSLLEFIGHFHPLLVHLPIGILLMGLLMQWVSQNEKYRPVQQAIPMVFLCGTITALLSAITGYLLSLTEDYDGKLVNWHMGMGIGVVVISSLLYAKERNIRLAMDKKLLSIGLLLLILITGHLGGSLTHGSDYLTDPLTRIIYSDSTGIATIKPVPNVQEALVYRDVIRPILQTNCFACHSARKQKGGLRMDDSLMLMKGGKDGKVIEPNHADDSEMIRRLLLPVDHDDHMPPKEKPQPTESQIDLIHWWISQGAGFTKRVKQLGQTDKIKPILLALQQVSLITKMPTDIPEEAVVKADETAMGQLKQRGVLVLPIAANSNYLMANFVTDTVINKEDLQLLLALKKQLVWLKMGFTNVSNEQMAVIGQLTNLTRLSLEHTSVSDDGLKPLQSIQNLHYLNLVDTKVTKAGVLQLSGLKSLHSLFLYQTTINQADWATLKEAFPKTQIDIGGYTVPTEVSDTTEVKVKRS